MTIYGTPVGLVDRLSNLCRRWKHDKSVPWVGLGAVYDLEAVLRLLTLPEFADWLRLQENPDLAEWAEPVRIAHEQRDALEAAITDHLPDTGANDLANDVTVAGETLADVRAALQDCGALSVDDKTTPIGPLLRALLT